MVADSKKVLLTRHETTEANLVRPVLKPGETLNPLGNEPESHVTVMYMTLGKILSLFSSMVRTQH